MAPSIFGVRVVVSKNIPIDRVRVQYRFPRSKRKRIRKKWREDMKNWKWEERHNAYMFGGTMYVHPEDWVVLTSLGMPVDVEGL